MLVETPYSGGVINPKTYLNHELDSKFFPLSSHACKLFYLLVFEKVSCKMSKNIIFLKIIGLGLNFTYEFEVCYTGIRCFTQRINALLCGNQAPEKVLAALAVLGAPWYLGATSIQKVFFLGAAQAL